MSGDPQVGAYILVFHGATRQGRSAAGSHREASIGMAWSHDLARWYWPE